VAAILANDIQLDCLLLCKCCHQGGLIPE